MEIPGNDVEEPSGQIMWCAGQGTHQPKMHCLLGRLLGTEFVSPQSHMLKY